MPESPASSHLPEGKRGGGREGRGHPGTSSTTSAGVSISGSSNNNNKTSASGARERDRGGGGGGGGAGGGRRLDDLTSPILYSTPEPSSAPCDVGRTGSAGVPLAVPGSTTSSSGGYTQEQQASGAPVSFPTSGMDASRLQQQLIEYTDSLFLEGLLDEQFTQLQLLQDANNPDFVSEVVSLFFDDSEKLLDQLTESLEGEPIDFKKVDAHVHQFKGSSSSIGALRVKTACVTFRQCCEDENSEGCRQALAQVKQEFFLVKAKLEVMLSLEQQLLAAGGSLPFME